MVEDSIVVFCFCLLFFRLMSKNIPYLEIIPALRTNFFFLEQQFSFPHGIKHFCYGGMKTLQNRFLHIHIPASRRSIPIYFYSQLVDCNRENDELKQLSELRNEIDLLFSALFWALYFTNFLAVVVLSFLLVAYSHHHLLTQLPNPMILKYLLVHNTWTVSEVSQLSP